MRPGDPHDPLLRQVLPLADELDDRTGLSTRTRCDETSATLAPRTAPEIRRAGS